MIDKRMMYALGQRVGGIMGSNAGSMLVTPTRDGSRPGYAGPNESNDGQGVGAGTSGNEGDGTSQNTNRERAIMSQYSGPGGTTGNINDFDEGDGGVDRSYVGPFSTYGVNKFAQNLKGPSVFSRIGDGFSRIGDGIGGYIKGGGLLGIGFRGLGNFFGGPTTKDTTAPDQRNMFNVSGPVVRPDFGDDGDNGQGIMQVQPNMLNVAGPVVEDETINTGGGDTEFVNRFEVSPEARQAQGVASLLEDKAIAEMISKLYT